MRTVKRYITGVVRYLVWKLRDAYANTQRMQDRANTAALHVEWETYRQEELADECYKLSARHDIAYEASAFRNMHYKFASNAVAVAGDKHRDNVFELRKLRAALESEEPSERLRALKVYTNLRTTRKELVLL